MANSLDIIEFVRPNTKDKNLYVTGISNRLTETTVFEKLNRVFSQFGVLYEVQVLGGSASTNQQHLTSEGQQTLASECQQTFTTESHDIAAEQSCMTMVSGSSHGLWAFVKYYSTQDAHRAQREINGKYLLHGKLLRVKFANRRKPVENSPLLGLQQCRELANHYLGFNGWSTQILTLDEDTESCEPNTARFIATVRIDVRYHNMHSEGIGVGEITYSATDPMTKITAFHRAKKIAHQQASEGAFSKLIVVVLPNGKVALEVNCTAVDARHFVTEDELKGVVTVTQVDQSSVRDKIECDIEGAVEDDATSDLDDINAQLLLDLQLDM